MLLPTKKNMHNLKVRKKIRAPEHSSLISVVVVKHCQFDSPMINWMGAPRS